MTRSLCTATVIGASLIMGSCAFMGMDSFEQWEVEQGDFLRRLPPEQLDSFPSHQHAIAYALGADCFETMEPQTPRDEAVKDACRSTEGVVLSEVMTFENFCQDLRANRDAGAEIPEGLFCDD